MADRDILVAALNGIDLDAAYEVFKVAYEKATGQSWSKELFIRRASNWEFYGDNDGFVTARRQRNGNLKLSGAAGNSLSILKGARQLIKENSEIGIWGTMDDKLATFLQKKMGFIRPPAAVIKALAPIIGRNGADIERVDDDGGLVVYIEEIGYVKKYFVCNINWIKGTVKWMLGAKEVSAADKSTIMSVIKEHLGIFGKFLPFVK